MSTTSIQWTRLSGRESPDEDLIGCLRRGAWYVAFRRLGRAFFRVVLYTALAAVIAIGIFYAMPPGLPLAATVPNPHDLPLYDFSSWIASGQAAQVGSNPYLVYPLTYMVRTGDTYVPAPNLNPPISVLAFQPFADAPPNLAFRLWHLVSFIVFLASVALLACAYPRFATRRRILWTFGFAGLWSTLELGQIYLPMLLALTGAWLLLRRHHQLAGGVLIGVVVAIKPNFLVWPALLFVGGYATAAIGAILCAALLSAWPAIVYGPQVYAQWLQVSTGFPGIVFAGNSSFISLAGRLGVYRVGIALSALLLVVVAALVWRHRPSVLALSSLAIVAALLTSPITWVGYTLFLMPILFSRPWTVPLRIVAASLIVPFPIVYLLFDGAFWRQVVFGSFWLWTLMLLLVVCVDEVRQIRPASITVR